jgi:hypothetical protein
MLIRLAFLCILQLALSSSSVFAQDATSPCGPVKIDGQLRYPGTNWFNVRGEQHFLPDCTTPTAPPDVGQPTAPSAAPPADSPAAQSQQPKIASPAAAQSQQVKTGCEGDLQCWGERFVRDASRACKKPIEEQTKYTVKWTNWWVDPIVSRWNWLDQEHGTLKYWGSDVEFQNGFGAMMSMWYRCDFDPATKTVLNVEVIEGRPPW